MMARRTRVQQVSSIAELTYLPASHAVIIASQGLQKHSSAEPQRPHAPVNAPFYQSAAHNTVLTPAYRRQDNDIYNNDAAGLSNTLHAMRVVLYEHQSLGDSIPLMPWPLLVFSKPLRLGT
jgi:hypothetical protein